MPSNKSKFLKYIFSTNRGCGGCGKSKLSDIIEPNAKPRTISIYSHNYPKPRFSSSSSCDRNGGLSLEEDDFTSTTVSLKSEPETDPKSTRLPSPSTMRIAGSIAVEKDSDDPYDDFRYSMLQMIIEEKIYTKSGLQELLNCFLDLNSPSHHEIIVKAFTAIWKEFISDKLLISETDQKPKAVAVGSTHVRWPCEGIEITHMGEGKEGNCMREGHNRHFMDS